MNYAQHYAQQIWLRHKKRERQRTNKTLALMYRYNLTVEEAQMVLIKMREAAKDRRFSQMTRNGIMKP